MVPGSIRNIHEGKVSGQMANAANHHSDRHGTEDYLNIVHRLSNEVQRHKLKMWSHSDFVMLADKLLLNNSTLFDLRTLGFIFCLFALISRSLN